MERNIQAVIFDLDGVLIDSEVFYMKRLGSFIASVTGQIVPEEVLARIAGGAGKTHWNTAQPYLPSNWQYEDYLKNYRAYLAGLPEDYRTLMFSSVPAVMRQLRERGIRMALATSSPEDKVCRVIHECGWESYLEVVMTRDQVRRFKPDPEIYEICLNKLGLTAQQCLVIEDSSVGIQAAKAAGILVAARTERRYPVDQSRADYYVEDLSELPGLLEKMG